MARRQIRTLTPTELARVQQGALVRIVDDDDSLRDALRFVLETEGWRVADYRSANDFFRGDAPSVPGCVVMDVRMPGLTGIEAQAVMNERGFSLPVIFLTGHGDIARLVAEGLTNRLIGERLSIAVRTVEVHRASALRKLGVRTPEEVRAVLEAGA